MRRATRNVIITNMKLIVISLIKLTHEFYICPSSRDKLTINNYYYSTELLTKYLSLKITIIVIGSRILKSHTRKLIMMRVINIIHDPRNHDLFVI